MSAGNCLWTDLENAVCQTVNMAFMLEATVESDREFYGDRREEAIAFGVYEVACRARKAQELYNKLHDVIHEPMRRQFEESVSTADENKPKEDRPSALNPGLLRRHCGGGARDSQQLRQARAGLGTAEAKHSPQSYR